MSNTVDFGAAMSALTTITLPGFPLAKQHRFVSVMPFAAIRQLVPEPKRLKVGDKHLPPELVQTAEDNRFIQRDFSGAKAKNVQPYADYILSHVTQGDGYMPRILVWTKDALVVDGYSIKWRMGTYGVVMDGQTGLQAAYEAYAKNPDTIGNMEFVLDIVHGVSREQAAQIFHDTNCLGVNVSAAASISRDSRDPLTDLVKHLCREVPSLIGKVDMTGRQLSKKSPNIITITSLRAVITCMAEGAAGVAHGNKPVSDMTHEELDALTGFVWDALPAFFAKYAGAIGDREASVIGLPGVLAAVGMLYHDELAGNLEDAGAVLESVDFRVGMNWHGIAVNISTEGKVTTAGGVKGSANECYKALALTETEQYKRVRGPFVPAPKPPERAKPAKK